MSLGSGCTSTLQAAVKQTAEVKRGISDISSKTVLKCFDIILTHYLSHCEVMSYLVLCLIGFPRFVAMFKRTPCLRNQYAVKHLASYNVLSNHLWRQKCWNHFWLAALERRREKPPLAASHWLPIHLPGPCVAWHDEYVRIIIFFFNADSQNFVWRWDALGRCVGSVSTLLPTF